jgi:protein O-mannosyl-transferase
VHPVCVNSVARVAELKNTLSLPFFLLSFIAYVRYDERTLHPAVEKNSRRATQWFALALLAFVCALLSKTSTIMLPVILVGYVFWRRGRIARMDWLHTAPFFVLSLGFGLLSMWFQKHQALAGQTLPSANLMERLAMAGWNFWFYLGKALAPVHLSVMYFRWKPDLSHLSAWLPDLALLLALVVCSFFRRTWLRHLQVGLGCFLVALFPALGLMDAQYLVKFQVSDHLQYLPLIVPMVLVAAALAALVRRKIYLLAGAILLLTLAGFSFRRAQVFSTPESLMRDTLQKNPMAWAAHNDLGVILAERKNYPAAAEHFNAALAANSENDDARLNLAQVLIAQGNFQAAREHLELALRHNPVSSAFHEKLGEVLAQLGDPQAAIEELKLSLRLEKGAHTNSRMALAGLYHATGNYAEAIQQYRLILATKPDLTEPRNNLAWLLATCPDASLRDGKKAVEYAEYACLVTKFKDPHVVGTLAAAYAEAGQFPEAVITGDFAVNLAAANQDWQLAQIGRQLLNYYHAGRAWHEQPVFTPAFK